MSQAMLLTPVTVFSCSEARGRHLCALSSWPAVPRTQLL